MGLDVPAYYVDPEAEGARAMTCLRKQLPELIAAE
jgi:hypothetical protein